MRIGYACLTAGIPNTSMRSCIIKNATPEKLCVLIEHNLLSLKNMLLFNAENNVRLFRISSGLIPFGSSPVKKLRWWELFEDKFKELGEIIKENDIRVSMHPGQYTVLNSPMPDVVARAIDDLIYHEKVLTALGTGQSSKIILHLGGVYGDKKTALKRFDAVYKDLPASIKGRLAIENDDKAYNITDVLETGGRNQIPVIYDNLHSEINPAGSSPHSYWVEKCSKTWRAQDGAQKIHYSQQAAGRAPGSHSKTIAVKEFAAFTESIGRDALDIMLEVKDKNISAVKCINALSNDKNAFLRDWRRYKYKVLELSPWHYAQAKKLIGAPDTVALDFYTVIEAAFMKTPDAESKALAAKTIWRDFFADAKAGEIKYFSEKLELFTLGKFPYAKLKRYLLKLAGDYNMAELKNSYYFHLN